MPEPGRPAATGDDADADADLLQRAAGLYAHTERGHLTDAAAALRAWSPVRPAVPWVPPPPRPARVSLPDPLPAPVFDPAAWHRDGFAVAGPALSPAALAAVAAAGTRVLEAAFATSGMDHLSTWAARVTQIPDPEAWDPTFAALADDPALCAVAAQALDRPTARCVWAHLVVKPPAVGGPLPWHTDRPTWPFPATVPGVAVWLSLDPMGPQSGGLAYRPGSHRGAADAADAVQPTVPAGHLLLHHADVLHCSRPNTSTAWRRAWIGVYAHPA